MYIILCVYCKIITTMASKRLNVIVEKVDQDRGGFCRDAIIAGSNVDKKTFDACIEKFRTRTDIEIENFQIVSPPEVQSDGTWKVVVGYNIVWMEFDRNFKFNPVLLRPTIKISSIISGRDDPDYAIIVADADDDNDEINECVEKFFKRNDVRNCAIYSPLQTKDDGTKQVVVSFQKRQYQYREFQFK